MPSVPKALQITMLAQNSVGQPLLMTWLITFSNSCDQFPVHSVGDRIGWTRFSMVSEPDSSLCPIVDATGSPTKAPVQAPNGGGGGTPTTSHPTYAPFPCRPYGSTRKSTKKKTDKSVATKGKGANIFSDPYYYQYYTGKGMSKSKSKKKSGKMGHSYSSKKHYYPAPKYYYGKSGMKSGKSRRLKKSSHSHKQLHYAYPGHGDYYWYAIGKGKGTGEYYMNTDEEDDDGWNNLPICPPPRPRPPVAPGSQKSYHAPAASPTADDDDQVHLKIPPPTRVPTSNIVNPTAPTGSQTQESQEKPTTGQSGGNTGTPPTRPVVSTWDDDKGGGGQAVRAVLFAGAGVAAGVIAIIATYIYRREKQYVAKELSLNRYARSEPRRLGALPRQPRVAMAETMSATVATESEVAALRA
mmetsp:Transcript_23599/g.44897  ORF Transcript_23599/g.44897 Transcript_23599/m.44897 type:complete len:411 (+) Transcript_23599:393-1625(+)